MFEKLNKDLKTLDNLEQSEILQGSLSNLEKLIKSENPVFQEVQTSFLEKAQTLKQNVVKKSDRFDSTLTENQEQENILTDSTEEIKSSFLTESFDRLQVTPTTSKLNKTLASVENDSSFDLNNRSGWIGNSSSDLAYTEEHLLICGCAFCSGSVFESGSVKIVEELEASTDFISNLEPIGYDGSIPLLSSDPSASAKIYLDFNGHRTSGTYWNSYYNDGKDFVTSAFTKSGKIERIVQRVAEDFAPFNVDVTTIEPGSFAATEAVRVVIGGSSQDWFGSSAGGVAFVNSWRWNGDTPAFVFEKELSSGEKNIAEAISHEVGHTLGLYHQSKYDSSGKKTQEYYSGSGSGDTGWAPIMGNSYGKNLSTWHKGTNSKNKSQDDLSIIASSNNGFGYRTDDHGNTKSAATALFGDTISSAGIISTSSDVDVFSFTTGTGDVSFDINVASVGANLDIVAQLWDDNELLLSSNPAAQLDANLDTFLEAGTYYLHVKNNGQYGRLGQYTIDGTVVASNDKPPSSFDSDQNNNGGTTTTNTDNNDPVVEEVTQTIGESGQIDNLNHKQQTILFDRSYDNPVVFAQPLSRNGGDTAMVRIDNIESDRLTVSLEEPSNKDGYHKYESFSYLVVEAGTWQFSDGTLLEVGTLNTDATTTSTWETVDWSTDFDDRPVVLSQVQTDNDDSYLGIRQRNIGADSFQLALEHEEALKMSKSGAATETVGWLAISAGQGSNNGQSYQAGYTGDAVKNGWYDLDFDFNFQEAPDLLASVASYDGPDPVGLRYQDLTSGGVQLRLDEDTSWDEETGHTSEEVAFLAIGSSDALTAQAYDPLQSQANAADVFSQSSDLFGMQGTDIFA